MTWKSTLLVSGAGVVATWLGVLSTPGSVSTDSSPRVAQSSHVAAGDADILTEAQRLHARIRPAGGYQRPVRNPFRFRSSTTLARPARPSVRLEPTPAPAPAPVPPPVRLAGIASDVVNGVTERTAVLSTDAGVVLVREGDQVAGHFRVVRIAEDSIALTGPDGGQITLPLSRGPR